MLSFSSFYTLGSDGEIESTPFHTDSLRSIWANMQILEPADLTLDKACRMPQYSYLLTYDALLYAESCITGF